MPLDDPNPNNVAELTKDDIHHLLSNTRRRRILKLLYEHGTLRKGELVDSVAAVEYEIPESDVTREQSKRVRVALHQSHLPTLAEYDVIRETDADYSLGPNAGPLLRHLDTGGRGIDRIKRALFR